MNNIQFVKTYVWAHKNGKTALDVAKKLDMNRNQVYAKANHLRKVGVKLPPIKVQFKHLDVEELNSLITQQLDSKV